MALLAAPLAVAAAPTPEQRAHRDGMRCHMVAKKTVWKFGNRSDEVGRRSVSRVTATATNRFHGLCPLAPHS